MLKPLKNSNVSKSIKVVCIVLIGLVMAQLFVEVVLMEKLTSGMSDQ